MKKLKEDRRTVLCRLKLPAAAADTQHRLQKKYQKNLILIQTA